MRLLSKLCVGGRGGHASYDDHVQFDQTIGDGDASHPEQWLVNRADGEFYNM